MSHFIISSNLVFIFGTPNGQASTQLEQAMHRGLRAVCTTPSPVFLMASAGHTSAQVGEWQCMHTTGTVCVDRPRSRYSRWIIECPRWVSHSVQAWAHAWQPMHRCGSMKNSRWSGTGMFHLCRLRLCGRLLAEPQAATYCCGSSSPSYAGGGADHAQPAVVVDVGRLEAHPGELAHQVGLLGRQAGPGQDGEG